MPGSLEESLEALEKDHEYLLRGDVFTKDALHEWLEFKRNKELNPVRMRPTPYEFYLYYDI
jgi:glutamine synthetase